MSTPRKPKAPLFRHAGHTVALVEDEDHPGAIRYKYLAGGKFYCVDCNAVGSIAISSWCYVCCTVLCAAHVHLTLTVHEGRKRNALVCRTCIIENEAKYVPYEPRRLAT